MERARRYSRRMLLRDGGILVAGATALAACATTPQVVEKEVTRIVEGTPQVVKETVVVKAPEGPVVVELLVPDWGEKYNKLVFDDVAGWFHEENPEVTINATHVQSHQEKLLTQIAAGLAPDSTYINYINAISFAFRGTLLPLDDRFAEAGLSPDDFHYGTMHSLMWDGKIYGFPMCYDAMGFFWNKNVYEDAGLDAESPPKTIVELEEHADKILKRNDAGDIERIGYGPSAFTFITFGFMRGGQYYLDMERKITADDPKIVEALEWEVAQVKKLDVNKLSAFWSASTETGAGGTPFTAGKVGIEYNGIWMGASYEEAAAESDFQYGLTYAPSLSGDLAEQEKLYQPSWGLGIPQGAKQPEWAFKFSKWYQVDNGVNVCAYTESTELYKPLVDEWIDRYVEERLGGQIKAYGKEFLKATSMASSWWPAIPVAALYNDEVNRAYDFAAHGQGTPQQVLADTTVKVQTELDRLLELMG